jgi:hypothetical protein
MRRGRKATGLLKGEEKIAGLPGMRQSGFFIGFSRGEAYLGMGLAKFLGSRRELWHVWEILSEA